MHYPPEHQCSWKNKNIDVHNLGIFIYSIDECINVLPPIEVSFESSLKVMFFNFVHDWKAPLSLG